MDAVLIVPRDQLSYGDAKDFMSRAEYDDNEAWERLDWKNVDEVPMPPVKEKLLLRISAPVVPKSHKGKAVFRHSDYYIIAKEIMSLKGLPLNQSSTRESLRRCYMRWYEFYNSCIASIEKLNKCILSLSYLGDVCRDLQRIIENREQKEVVTFSRDVKESLDMILESEYMEANDLFKSRFESEMMFLSPEKDVAQAFLDEMPYSPALDGFRKCIIDYLEGKTDIINSPIRI